MRKLLIISTAMFFGLCAQQHPGVEKKFFKTYSNDIPTPAFKGKGIKYSKVEDLSAFGAALKAKFSDFQIDTLGTSHHGKPIIAWRIGSQNTGAKVWLQGGLHGNEPASSEGLMYFCYELINNADLAELKNNFNFLIVPMANPDGYEKQKRLNDQNLDLNRDQTAYMGHETPYLKAAFYDFNPDVAIDFHEYKPYRADYFGATDFGITQLNDVMMLPSGNLNVDEGLRMLNMELLVQPNMEMLKAEGMHSSIYVSTRKEEGVTYLNYGSTSSRSSSTSYGLSNCLSILFEFRGVGLSKNSFSRRVTLTKNVAVHSLKQVLAHQSRLLETIQMANKKTMERTTPYTVRFKAQEEMISYEFIDLSSKEVKPFDFPLRNGMKLEGTIVRERPQAYIIPADQEKTIQNLKINGIQVEVLQEDQQMEVQMFKVDERWESATSFQKIHTVQARGEMVDTTVMVPKGSYIVYTAQENGNYLGELLEPEGPNSYTHFRIVECKLNEFHPYLRLK